MKVEINPILMKIGDNFVAKHTQKQVYYNRAETFALLTAMCWRNKPNLPKFMGPKNMVKYLEMPADLAQRFSAFLKTQVVLLKQLDADNDNDFYGKETDPEMGNPTYEKIVIEVETRMSWDELDAENHAVGLWWGGMMWPYFTFIESGIYQAINRYNILKVL